MSKQTVITAQMNDKLRDLMRKDKERKEQQTFERLRNELQLAFSAPDSSYNPLTANDIVERNNR